MFFYAPYNSPVLVTLAVAYGLVASITTFDIRIVQAKKNGLLPIDEPTLPKWVAILYWLEWLIFIAMLLLNWKFALIAFVVKFISKVLPVLEIIGNILTSPLRRKSK